MRGAIYMTSMGIAHPLLLSFPPNQKISPLSTYYMCSYQVLALKDVDDTGSV